MNDRLRLSIPSRRAAIPCVVRRHKIAIDELNAVNYEDYKTNRFKVKHLSDCHCELYGRPEGLSLRSAHVQTSIRRTSALRLIRHWFLPEFWSR